MNHTSTAPSRWVSRARRKRAARSLTPLVLAVTVIAFVAIAVSQHFGVVRAQAPAPEALKIASLKTVPVPEPRNLAAFIKDRKAAIALGKALFWDMAAGSDGQACASCHFHAGADSRSKNQLNPAFRAIPPDNTFSVFGMDGGGPNYQLTTDDFPFHKIVDVDDRDSAVLFDTNDIASSQGVFFFNFTGIPPSDPPGPAVLGVLPTPDRGTIVSPDPVFNVQGINVRGVEPRQTPTIINAVFNHRNFWDGRARFEFNGRNPIGKLDPDAKVVHVPFPGGMPEEISLIDGSHSEFELENSSLASQAVGPPLSNLEMSFDGRTFPLIGRKMVPRRALAHQTVAIDDSVLGSMSVGLGLNTTYRNLIKAAFQNEWWDTAWTVQVNPDGSVTMLPPGAAYPAALSDTSANAYCFRLIEYNFPLFWGLAIQMYESTLVAHDSRVDQFLDGKTYALTAEEQKGLEIFEGKGKCVNCHGGAETTNASVANVINEVLERMIMGDERIAVYDNGFYNIGTRPCEGLRFDDTQGPCDDLGLGATIGPRNLPLSNSRFFQRPENIDQAPPIPPRPEESPLLAEPLPLQPNERVAVDGAFKTPGLRNLELTAPYFHHGGVLTLDQVVEFYNRGADFARVNQNNLDPDIQPLRLTADEKKWLVAFLMALTDERVRHESAPFDHPELLVPNGATGTHRLVIDDGSGKAAEDVVKIPAVGMNGRPVPDRNFLDTPPVPLSAPPLPPPPPPPAAPVLAVQPGSMTFHTPVGIQPPVELLQITNQGGGSLTWSASETLSWLSLSVTSGTAPSSPGVLVNPIGLAVGSYTGTITFTAPGVSGSPSIVSVTLTVTLPPLVLAPALLLAPALPAGNQLTWTGNHRPGEAVRLSARGSRGAPPADVARAFSLWASEATWRGKPTFRPARRAAIAHEADCEFMG